MFLQLGGCQFSSITETNITAIDFGGHRTEISQSNLRISQFCMYLVDKKHSCVGYRTLGSAVLCRDGDKISRVSLPDLGFFPVWGRRSEYSGPSVIYGEILFQALQHFYFSADTENQ